MEKERSSFCAMMSRMKYIDRWALMRNTRKENISEHSLEVAMITHLLATIGKVRFHKNLNAERATLIGVYHDCTEIITGDMPTPIKYYSKEMRDTFQTIENVATKQLLDMLPEDIKDEYKKFFEPEEDDNYLWKLVKAADKLSALMKCIEEEKAGNTEFFSAKTATKISIDNMGLEEVQVFCEEFLPAYEMNLDELRE